MRPELHDEPSRPLLPAALLIPLLLMLLGWSLLLPAHAGERRARLTIELQLDGTNRWSDAGDASQTKLSRHYRLVTYLRADGEPMSVNTKAPDYAQTMMNRSAQVQAQVAQARTRPTQAAAPAAQDAAARMAMAQQARATCGEDRDCLMRLLMPQIAAQTTSDPALQARLVQHGRTAKAEDDGEELRYLNFSGVDRCDAQFQVRADETSEGHYADVQGPVPWRETRSVSGALPADELRLLCLGFSLVLDLRTQAITTDAGFGLPEPMATTLRTERGRSTRSDGRLASIGPVAQWVAERTRQAPRAGSASATLPWVAPATAGRGRADGAVKATLSWKLEDL
jgi:hypothetical protein